MSELDLSFKTEDLSFEDTPILTEEADPEEEIEDPLKLIQESLEDFPPLSIMVDNKDDLSNDTPPERSSLFKNDPVLPILRPAKKLKKSFRRIAQVSFFCCSLGREKIQQLYFYL